MKSRHKLFTLRGIIQAVLLIDYNSLFTGDSYIPGIKTVTNLPASNKEQARISEEKIKSLSDDKLIYPGHLIPEIPWHH